MYSTTNTAAHLRLPILLVVAFRRFLFLLDQPKPIIATFPSRHRLLPDNCLDLASILGYVLRSAFVFPCPDVLYVLCDVIFASRTPDFESPHAICHTPHPILPRSIHRHRIQTPRHPVGEFCLGQIRSSNDMPLLTSLNASLTHLGCSCPFYHVLPICLSKPNAGKHCMSVKTSMPCHYPNAPFLHSPACPYPHRSILIRRPPK